MTRNLPRPHERLAVSEPCKVEWGSMRGSDRVRFCSHCSLHVHNLAEMTPSQAMELALRSGGRLCLRIERDPAGLPRTRTLTEPLYQIGRRASRLAAGAFGAALTLSAAVAAQAQAAGPETAQQAVQVQTNPTLVTSAGATLVGTVLDPNGAIIPSADVTLTHNETGTQFQMSADAEGAYRFESLPAGAYTLRVAAVGFEPFEAQDLKVEAGVEQRADAALRVLSIAVDGGTINGGTFVRWETVTMGVVVVAAEPSEPLVRAAKENDLRTIRRMLLFEGADIDVVDKRLGITALAQAFNDGNRELVRELLSRGAAANTRLSYRQTALMRLRPETSVDLVRDLLDGGARVNLRDEDGDTALMIAAQLGRQDIVELLLRAGARVNARSKEGRTPLINAASANATETVRALITAGADISLRDKEGRSALWHARHAEGDDAASLLLAYGAYEDPQEPEAKPNQ